MSDITLWGSAGSPNYHDCLIFQPFLERAPSIYTDGKRFYLDSVAGESPDPFHVHSDQFFTPEGLEGMVVGPNFDTFPEGAIGYFCEAFNKIGTQVSSYPVNHSVEFDEKGERDYQGPYTLKNIIATSKHPKIEEGFYVFKSGETRLIKVLDELEAEKPGTVLYDVAPYFREQKTFTVRGEKRRLAKYEDSLVIMVKDPQEFFEAFRDYLVGHLRETARTGTQFDMAAAGIKLGQTIHGDKTVIHDKGEEIVLMYYDQFMPVYLPQKDYEKVASFQFLDFPHKRTEAEIRSELLDIADLIRRKAVLDLK